MNHPRPNVARVRRGLSPWSVVAVLGALVVALALFARANTITVESAVVYDLPLSSGAPIFSDALTPSKPGSVFLITVEVDGAEALIEPLVRRGSEAWQPLPLNGPTGAIGEDQLHTFSFQAPSAAPAHPSTAATALSYNVRVTFEGSARAVLLVVGEAVNQ